MAQKQGGGDVGGAFLDGDEDGRPSGVGSDSRDGFAMF